MILIFDLDDTLYPERSYVESGFRAVAEMGERRFGWESSKSFRELVELIDGQGRGRVFDAWLERYGRRSRRLVEECVRCYRHHQPDIRLDPHAARILPDLAERYPLYVITDGNKVVQQKKVDALGISGYFRRVLITHRFGRARAKPSPYCFERIKLWERSGWDQLAYVGDDPSKDFVALNRRGGRTIRVMTGRHSTVSAQPGYDAVHRIAHLGELGALV